jgi:hypothetical protein
MQHWGIAIGRDGIFEDAGMIAGSAFGGLAWEKWGYPTTLLAGTIATGIGSLFGLRFLKEPVHKGWEGSDSPSNLE